MQYLGHSDPHGQRSGQALRALRKCGGNQDDAMVILIAAMEEREQAQKIDETRIASELQSQVRWWCVVLLKRLCAIHSFISCVSNKAQSPSSVWLTLA